LEKIPQDEISRHEILLKKILQKTDKSADLTIAGSYRRRLPESGDIDVLLKSDNPETYNKFIKSLNDLGYLVDHLALGNKKYNGVCKLGKKGLARRIDIMYTKPEEYPFAIFYFTGSGDFNKVVRQKILDKGMTINEYSLKDLKTKEPVNHVFTEEKDIFNYLGFDYVEPWDRM
jgi:DNA polymerase/3'-5' exonuclease PolX